MIDLLTRLNEHTLGLKNVKTQTLPTTSMKIPTIKLTLENLNYLELPETELSSHFRNFKHRQTETGHKR